MRPLPLTTSRKPGDRSDDDTAGEHVFHAGCHAPDDMGIGLTGGGGGGVPGRLHRRPSGEHVLPKGQHVLPLVALPPGHAVALADGQQPRKVPDAGEIMQVLASGQTGEAAPEE